MILSGSEIRARLGGDIRIDPFGQSLVGMEDDVADALPAEFGKKARAKFGGGKRHGNPRE